MNAPTEKKLDIDVGISPMLDRVVLVIDGYPPIGLVKSDAREMAQRINGAADQLEDMTDPTRKN